MSNVTIEQQVDRVLHKPWDRPRRRSETRRLHSDTRPVWGTFALPAEFATPGLRWWGRMVFAPLAEQRKETPTRTAAMGAVLEEVMEVWTKEEAGETEPSAPPPPVATLFQPGDEVEHPRFGAGLVMALEDRTMTLRQEDPDKAMRRSWILGKLQRELQKMPLNMGELARLQGLLGECDARPAPAPVTAVVPSLLVEFYDGRVRSFAVSAAADCLDLTEKAARKGCQTRMEWAALCGLDEGQWVDNTQQWDTPPDGMLPESPVHGAPLEKPHPIHGQGKVLYQRQFRRHRVVVVFHADRGLLWPSAACQHYRVEDAAPPPAPGPAIAERSCILRPVALH